MSNESDRDLWVFGYGSLIWKPDLPYVEARTGHIKGFVRRFWQHSTDHRGLPGAPGRVVTVIPYEEWKEFEDEHHSPEDTVTWGKVYRIPEAEVEMVRRKLDYREKGGYSVHRVDVYSRIGDDVPTVKGAIAYIGTTSNECFVGPAPRDDVVRQIATSIGPSGRNSVYLIELAMAMRTLIPEGRDDHLFELEQGVNEYIRVHGDAKALGVNGAAGGDSLVGSS